MYAPGRDAQGKQHDNNRRLYSLRMLQQCAVLYTATRSMTLSLYRVVNVALGILTKYTYASYASIDVTRLTDDVFNRLIRLHSYCDYLDLFSSRCCPV